MADDANVANWFIWALEIITHSADRPGGVSFTPGFFTQWDRNDLPSLPPTGTCAPGPASRPELSAWLGEYPCAAMADEIEAGNLRRAVRRGRKRRAQPAEPSATGCCATPAGGARRGRERRHHGDHGSRDPRLALHGPAGTVRPHGDPRRADAVGDVPVHRRRPRPRGGTPPDVVGLCGARPAHRRRRVPGSRPRHRIRRRRARARTAGSTSGSRRPPPRRRSRPTGRDRPRGVRVGAPSVCCATVAGGSRRPSSCGNSTRCATRRSWYSSRNVRCDTRTRSTAGWATDRTSRSIRSTPPQSTSRMVIR